MKINSALILLTIFLGHSANSQEEELVAPGAKLHLVADDFEFTEGPAADSLGNVFFTDQPNNRIHKWSVEDNNVSVFMENTGRSNGLYFDKEGNLFACADKDSEIWKIDKDKNVTVLVNDYQGNRLNGPNDLWIAPGGGIFFTDPFYQRSYWDHTEQPIQKERVYYFSPDKKELKIATDDLKKPNGIIGTPDGRNLYVADIGDNKTWKYSIGKDGRLENKTLFTELGSDGMTIDEQGNLYLTGDGVSVFNSRGEKILYIPIDKDWTANVTFGGKDKKTLFITAMDSLFSLEMNVRGK